MYRSSVVLTALAALALASCAGGVQKARFRHAALGVVPSDHPELVKVREACGAKVYAAGITMHGKVITSRKAALRIYVNDMLYQPGVAAHAGTMAAIAVSSGRPELAFAPGTRPAPAPRPAYKDRLDALERQVWACVEAAGWQKLPPAR